MFTGVRTPSPEAAQKINRALDCGALALASTVAALRDGELDARVAVVCFACAGVLWLAAARVLRQYDAAAGRSDLGDMALTLVMVLAVAGPITLAGAALGAPLGQSVFRFGLTLAPIALVVRLCVARRAPWRQSVRDVLIAGVSPLGRLTGKELAEHDPERRVLGYLRFDDEAASPRLRAPVIGTTGELLAVLQRHAVDEVYFASTSSAHAADVQAAIQVCERLGVPFALPVCAYRLGRAKPECGRAVADGYLHFSTVQMKPLQLKLKRLFDIVASGAALVALSPLLIAVAIAIKVTSPGPVLFRQERVGLRGRPFGMLKFRSMVANAEELKATLLQANEQTGPVFKMKADPRVTTVGRVIRKYSIDELAQLVNVLRGDMSVVGPRPPVPSEVARYEAWQRRRLSVRPGLTCIWQVSGRNQIDFDQWMRLDMRYIDHWSLIWDFRLILATVPVVVTGRGAS